MTNYFLQTLQHLRHYEEIMLYGNLLEVSEQQQDEAINYLAKEYNREAIGYPYAAPEFDPSAALWAARTVYIAAQLMLYRENKESDIEILLPPYEQRITSSAMLSADLTLRFLPNVIIHLKVLDPEDKLIEVLEKHLTVWHYSGINYSLSINELNFDFIIPNKCLHQLYIDKVIEKKRISLANHPALIEGVKAALGIFTHVYWNDFKQQALQNEPN